MSATQSPVEFWTLENSLRLRASTDAWRSPRCLYSVWSEASQWSKYIPTDDSPGVGSSSHGYLPFGISRRKNGSSDDDVRW